MAAIVPDPPPEVPQTMESARLHAEIARLNLRLGAQHGAYELKFETQQAEIARLRGDLDEVEAGKGRLVKECVRLRTQLANVLKEHRERLQANAGLRAELSDDSPGTPLGRLNAIGEFAVGLGLCTGTEAKPSELFVMDEVARLRAELERQGEKILAERDRLRADQTKYHQNLTEIAQQHVKYLDHLRAELASWQHNYLHLRSLLGVGREDGETDAHLWQRTETALRKMRNELAAARREIHDKSLLIDVVHQERDTARADLAAARQDADRLLSLVNDLGVRLKSSQADTELLRTHLVSKLISERGRRRLVMFNELSYKDVCTELTQSKAEIARIHTELAAARQDANRLLEALDELHAFVEREHDLINNPNCPTCVALMKASDVLRTSPPPGKDLMQAKGGSDMGPQESLA
jgi:hypothetical protein